MSRIVIIVAGGFVQNVYTDGDIDYVVLDQDMVDQADAGTVMLTHGGGVVLLWGAFLPQESAYDPDFVAQAFHAVQGVEA